MEKVIGLPAHALPSSILSIQTGRTILQTFQVLPAPMKFSRIELTRQFYPTATALTIWIEFGSREVRRFH